MLTSPQDTGPGPSFRLVTTFTSVPVVVTVTAPTQTLFTTECGDNVRPPPPPPPPPNPNTTPTPTPPTVYNVAPVTLTSTSTSTDPNGNLVLVTVVNVSTPSPASSQSSAGPPPAVIGGIVGGVVGLLALAGIIFLIWKKRRSRWDYDGEDDGQYYAGAVKVD